MAGWRVLQSPVAYSNRGSPINLITKWDDWLELRLVPYDTPLPGECTVEQQTKANIVYANSI